MTDAKGETKARLWVRVQPRASRTEITGIDEAGVLRIRLKAPPVDGAANKELLKFLGKKVLGLPPSSLRITSGQSSREKSVEVPGMTDEELRQSLAAAGASRSPKDSSKK
jgi:uncharacterized protein (TIGR00251 family)